MKKIAFGGGCHWCTEAVFAGLHGVNDVTQGYVSSVSPYDNFSEAVIVTYSPFVISLHQLIEVHLHTHSATSQHSMRKKYRSAVYYFDKADEIIITQSIQQLQPQFQQKIITQVLPFVGFQSSLAEYQEYFKNHAGNGFCERYIIPKIDLIKNSFPGLA